MIERLNEIFVNVSINDTFKRVDPNHNLDFFIGLDEFGNRTLILLSKGEIGNVESSKSIKVTINRRKDSSIALGFHLYNKAMQHSFTRFCEDLIVSSRNIDKNSGLGFTVTRYKAWREMFKNIYSDILSEQTIRGLIGELLFLKGYMFAKYGYARSIVSWMGPDKAHKDFELDNIWYEIKAVNENSITVKISSVEQLDAKNEGELVVFFLDKTNFENNNSITLNKLVEEIILLIGDNNIIELFLKKLNNCGYNMSEEYDKYHYKCDKHNRYIVDEGFPKLSKNDLKEGIARISYDIYLKDINKFKI